MIKFNYEQKGFKVFLFKPKYDNRCVENGTAYVASRIGLKSECIEFASDDVFTNLCEKHDILNESTVKNNVIVVINKTYLKSIS